MKIEKQRAIEGRFKQKMKVYVWRMRIKKVEYLSSKKEISRNKTKPSNLWIRYEFLEKGLLHPVGMPRSTYYF